MASYLSQEEQSRVEISWLSSGGRGLVAKRHIPDGLSIITCKPITWALDSRCLKDTCDNCLFVQDSNTASKASPKASRKALRPCGGCHTVKYCDKHCQKHAWQQHHSLECKMFAKLQPRVLPNNVRALLHLLLQRKAGRITEQQWDELKELEGHWEDTIYRGLDADSNEIVRPMQGREARYNDIQLIAYATKTYADMPLDLNDVIQLVSTFMINAFTLVSSTYDPLGLALQPLLALVNHSCDYNAVVRYNGLDMSLIAIRPILKDEEITISYIDDTHPKTKRQQELKERYFFKCRCKRCNMPSGSPIDDFLSYEKRPLAELEETEERAVALTQLADAEIDPKEKIRKLEYGLHLMQATSVWPLQRYPYPAVRHQLILACLDGQQYYLAFAHAAIQNWRLDPVLMPVKHHPIRMVHQWVFIRLMDHIADCGESELGTQTFDLLRYTIDVDFWSSYVLREMMQAVAIVGWPGFPKSSEEQPLRVPPIPSRRGPTLDDDKERYERERKKIERMMDDVLEAEKEWNDIVTYLHRLDPTSR